MPSTEGLIRIQAHSWETWGDINNFFRRAELDRESGVFRGENETYSYKFAINTIFSLRPDGSSTRTSANYIVLAKILKEIVKENEAPEESFAKRVLNCFTCSLCGTDLTYKEKRIIADALLEPKDFEKPVTYVDDWDPSC